MNIVCNVERLTIYTENRMSLLKEWLETNFIPIVQNDFDITLISDEEDTFGMLIGIQFNSHQQGGYFYLWESFVVAYQLVDYQLESELIKDTLVTDLSGYEFYERLNNIVRMFQTKLRFGS